MLNFFEALLFLLSSIETKTERWAVSQWKMDISFRHIKQTFTLNFKHLTESMRHLLYSHAAKYESKNVSLRSSQRRDL